jgi:hypothetical protein
MSEATIDVVDCRVAVVGGTADDVKYTADSVG